MKDIFGIQEYTHSVESIDPTKLTHDELRQLVLRLKNAVVTAYIKLGKLLDYIKKNKIYQEWGYASFLSYIENELGIRARKCELLMDVYRFVGKYNISDQKIEKLDISKLYELARWERAGKVNKRNIDTVLEKAETQKLDELIIERVKENARDVIFSVRMSREQYESFKDLVENHFKKDIKEDASFGWVMSALELFYRGFNFKGGFEDLKTLLQRFEKLFNIRIFFIKYDGSNQYERLLELAGEIAQYARQFADDLKVTKLDQKNEKIRKDVDKLKKIEEIMPWKTV